MKTISKLGLISSLFLISIPTSFAAQTFNVGAMNNDERIELLQQLREKSRDVKPTSWTDIKGWRDMGGRWAGALDGQGKLLAIYDLSYPMLFHTVPVAAVGNTKVDFKEVSSKIQMYSTATGDDRGGLAQDAIDVISKLGDSSEAQGFFAKDWWKKVPWKNARLRGATGEPSSFKLSDIDLSQTMRNPSTLLDLIARLEKTSDEEGAPILGAGFLSRLEFVRTRQGEFTINWTPPTWMNPLPKKVVDFQSRYSGVIEHLEWRILSTLLSTAINSMNIPIVCSILGTALDRVVHFHDLLLSSHQEMAMEMVNAAQEGGLTSVGFPGLGTDGRTAAGGYLTLSETHTLALWKWIFKNPNDAWMQQLADDSQTSSDSVDYLKAAGDAVSLLNGRFGMITSPGRSTPDQMYVLANQVLGKKYGPSVSVDYKSPKQVQRTRVAFEINSALVDFASYFVPFGGGVVREAYGYFIEGKMDTAKTWEARLVAHLEQRSTQKGENWTKEISILQDQSISLFEVSPADSDALVHYWRNKLGL